MSIFSITGGSTPWVWMGLSLALSCVVAFLLVFFKKSPKGATSLSCGGGLLAAILSIVAAISALAQGGTAVALTTGEGGFDFAHFLLNPLSSFMIIVLGILSIAVWIYSFSYMEEYERYGLAKMGCFLNLFIAAMQLVILADDVLWFLVFFELMSLASYFLVILEEKPESIKAGLLYLVMAHIGLVLIMIGFFVMAGQAGSLSFADMRSTQFSGAVANLAFLLCFLGFGIKAGMIPFHSWLPLAHPAAPSNVSCLMSGGMIKIGIFGIIKVSFDLLGASVPPMWWGVVVLIFGAVSSVLGVIYALVEHDLKKLLAYHSVENIGIILMGVGVALLGMKYMPLIACLGLMAALFHLLNHAVFKGLLFLGAGSVMYAAHGKNMNTLGGLEHKMPITAACFLIGALAIAAIPPLNGFMSEWFIYQGLFSLAGNAFADTTIVRILAVASIVALAITGALAVTCFVKAYGITFAGCPRSQQAASAQETPITMRIGQILLALLCVVLGVGAYWTAPHLFSISQASINMPQLASAEIPSLFSGSMFTTQVMTSGQLGVSSNINMTSTFIMAIILIAAFIGVYLVKTFGARGGKGVRSGAWMCGYEFNFDMPVQASSFASHLKEFFKPLYAFRASCAQLGKPIGKGFKGLQSGLGTHEGLPDKVLVDKPSAFVDRLSDRFAPLAHGNFAWYCLYIVVALVVLLALAVALVS